MTKVVNLCDICGRDIVDVKIKYEAKRKRILIFPYKTWNDIDLCEDCLSKIIKVKANKAEALTDGDETKQEATQEAIDCIKAIHVQMFNDGNTKWTEACDMAIKALEQQKIGEWIKEHGSIYKCSNCGNFLDFDGVNAGRGDANYCPNCGAKMEDGNDR